MGRLNHNNNAQTAMLQEGPEIRTPNEQTANLTPVSKTHVNSDYANVHFRAQTLKYNILIY